MNIEKELQKRSAGNCELCSSQESLSVFLVPPKTVLISDNCAYLCITCSKQIEDPELINPNHWRCLNDSIWSQVTAVQVLSWRILQRLKGEGWPQDLLNMMYLEEESLKWAKAMGDGEDIEDTLIHKDAHGATLQAGDSVVLIKDLDVKGANFTAKRGTAVRNISLVHGNDAYIEGKVNGQQIVILTKFVKKSS